MGSAEAGLRAALLADYVARPDFDRSARASMLSGSLRSYASEGDLSELLKAAASSLPGATAMHRDGESDLGAANQRLSVALTLVSFTRSISRPSISRLSGRLPIVALLFAVIPLAVGVVLFGAPALAEPSAAERRAQITRVVDGINSPDPATRLVTLERAAASKDRNLRRVALSTAFASSDSDLRAAALTAAIANAQTFVVDIADSRDGKNIVAQGTARSLEVRITSFDRATNAFRATSRYSRGLSTRGDVSGDRISFEVMLSEIGLFGWHCSGVGRLQGGGATLQGSMSCNPGNVYNAAPEMYEIKIEVLR